MRKWHKGLLAFSLALALVGCGKANTSVNDIGNVDGQVSDNAFDSTESSVASGTTIETASTYEDSSNEADGEIAGETQEVGKVVLAKGKDGTDSEESTVPIENTDAGSWLKTPKGYMFKSKETAEFVKNSLMSVGDYQYYFDADGYLQINTFVKDDGKEWYLLNCQKVFGFVEADGNTYYVDANKGVLTLCSAKIDGQVYWFDDSGKSISEEEFKELSE